MNAFIVKVDVPKSKTGEVMYFRLMKFVLLINCVIFASFAAQSDNARSKKRTENIDATFQRALQYRDGWKDIRQDPVMAKQLFESVIQHDPKHARAIHNLGLIVQKASSYKEAQAHFQTAAKLGIETSQKAIWQMLIAREIEASIKDRFLAICDLHAYPLPLKRETIEFDYQLIAFKNNGHKEMEGAMFAQEFYNAGYLSAPIIWVENPDKFRNTGTILTKLLIVGTQRIMD